MVVTLVVTLVVTMIVKMVVTMVVPVVVPVVVPMVRVVEVCRFWLIMKLFALTKQVIMLYEIYFIRNYYFSIINRIIILMVVII